MAPSAHLICAPPLRSSPSFEAAEIRSRTIPGICWALVRWVDFWLGLQISHCHTCKFASYLSSTLPSAHLGTEAKSVLILFCLLSLAGHPDLPVLVMPKLRQRMSCKRGRSWGKTGRQASSSTTDSSTFCSDFCMDRYQATRSGRGRGRGLHNLEASSFNFATNTAWLQFPCTHGNFSFMASVTIELSEINACHEAVSLGVAKDMLAEGRNGTIQMNYEHSKASRSGKGMASQIMNDQAGPSIPTSKEGHHFEDEDDYKYGCPPLLMKFKQVCALWFLGIQYARGYSLITYLTVMIRAPALIAGALCLPTVFGLGCSLSCF